MESMSWKKGNRRPQHERIIMELASSAMLWHECFRDQETTFVHRYRSGFGVLRQARSESGPFRDRTGNQPEDQAA